MAKVTQLVLVGHTKVRLVDGIKRVPTDKLVLVVGDIPNLEGEAKVVEIAEAIESIFRDLMTIEWLKVDKEDIFAAARTILQKVEDEVEGGIEVKINISGSLRQMAIACYIAALVSKTPIFSVLPEYDANFQEIGVKEVYEIPYFPIKQVSAAEVEILKVVNQKGIVESIEQLMAETYGKVTEQDYNRVRAKISYYVKELEEEGYIQKRRAGQKVQIELTQLGEIYVVGQEISKLKEARNKEEKEKE